MRFPQALLQVPEIDVFPIPLVVLGIDALQLSKLMCSPYFMQTQEVDAFPILPAARKVDVFPILHAAPGS